MLCFINFVAIRRSLVVAVSTACALCGALYGCRKSSKAAQHHESEVLCKTSHEPSHGTSPSSTGPSIATLPEHPDAPPKAATPRLDVPSRSLTSELKISPRSAVCELKLHPKGAPPVATPSSITPRSSSMAPPTSSAIVTPRSSSMAPPTSSAIVTPRSSSMAPPTSSAIVTPRSSCMAPPTSSAIVTPRGSSMTTLTTPSPAAIVTPRPIGSTTAASPASTSCFVLLEPAAAAAKLAANADIATQVAKYNAETTRQRLTAHRAKLAAERAELNDKKARGEIALDEDELDYQAALAARAALAGERGRLSAEEKAALLQRGKEARQQQESKRVDRNWVGLGEREKKEAAVKFMQDYYSRLAATAPTTEDLIDPAGGGDLGDDGLIGAGYTLTSGPGSNNNGNHTTHAVQDDVDEGDPEWL
eukprot:jgi/Chrzof1/6946/Cz02g05030.t1